MRKEVEALKHHAGGAPLPGDLLFAERVQRVADASIAGQFAVEPKRSRVDPLKLIDAPKERRLSPTRGADDADDFPCLDVQGDVLESPNIPEALSDFDCR